MSEQFRANYVDMDGRHFDATLFLSSVTITIRYQEQGTVKDRYWLAEQIQQMRPMDGREVLEYRNPEGGKELLYVSDPYVTTSIKKQFKHLPFVGGVYYHTVGKTRNKILFIFLAIAALFFSAYLWLVPWMAEKFAMNFSRDYEIEMGESMYRSMEAGFKIDSTKTRLLNRFYRQLNYGVNYPVQITVVKSEELNAFAVPGGHIVVYDAIIDKMDRPDELAALLGHESSHIALRHSLRNLSRELSRKMFLLLIFGSDSGIGSFIAGHADALKGLQYSRSLETEADNNGIQLMVKRGLDPHGMIRLMQLLQKASGSNEPVSFLNTHPVFKNRIDNIRKQIGNSTPPGSNQQELQDIFAELKQEVRDAQW